MASCMSRDYNNGKIYCIRNTITDDIYVGSTTQLLCKRMAKHRSDTQRDVKNNNRIYQKMNELGVENFYIELIEEYPCENNDQLRAREGHFIREMATLNGRIEGRDRKEHYQDNKEYIKEKSNKNYHDNIEARKAQKKEYYYNNKDKMDEYQKLYRENNKEAIAERKKKCVESKKEYYKQQKKAYYEANKEEINRRRREKWQQKKAEEQK